MTTSSKGFYYHTEDFKIEEVIDKVSSKLEGVPDNINKVTKKTKDAIPVDELFDCRFTEEWTAPNYENGLAAFRTPYSDLNEKSREKEITHLKETKGQFFYIVAKVEGESTTETVSCLIEIRGRAADTKTEYFIQEYLIGTPDI